MLCADGQKIQDIQKKKILKEISTACAKLELVITQCSRYIDKEVLDKFLAQFGYPKLESKMSALLAVEEYTAPS